jgi:DNA ligase-1
MRVEVPVGYVAFDMIALGALDEEPRPLLDASLADRRTRLEALQLPAGRIVLGHLGHPSTADELDAAFVDARARGNEGLVVKDPRSGYTPGRRGLAWLKLKKALATLDCVVVGVEVGHGKRHGVLSDYTFAVRDDRPGHDGGLVTLGKAYSGLTDAEIAEMTRWFEAHTLKRLGRYRLVEPTVVVEVAFDRVQPSTRHASGFALRFPRIARLRPDKRPADADTLSVVAALAG